MCGTFWKTTRPSMAMFRLVAGAFWNGLATDQQALLTEVWESSIAEYRAPHGRRPQIAGAREAGGARCSVHHAGCSTDGCRSEQNDCRHRSGLVKQWRITPEIAAQALMDAG